MFGKKTSKFNASRLSATPETAFEKERRIRNPDQRSRDAARDELQIHMMRRISL